MLADALAGYLGLWQLLALVAVYGGLSFDTLFPAGFVALVGLGLPWLTRPWDDEGPIEPPVVVEPRPPLVAFALILAVAAWGGFHFAKLELHLVAFAVAPLVWLYVAPSKRVGGAVAPAASWLDLAAIVGVGVMAATVTLNLRRADVDDGYYLNAVLQTLAQSHLPVLGFDGIHGDPTAPIQQVIHRPQTFELLVAWWTKLLGMPGRFVYWVLAPAVAASTVGLVHWTLVKRLAPRLAPLALVVALGVALVWGDGDQTMGRFGFPRLFQGKSVFVTCAMPLLAAALLAFGQRPTWRSWLRVLAVGFGATAFTSTALVVVPIALAFGALGGLRRDRTAAFGTLAAWAVAVPVVGVLGMLYLELQAAGGLASDGHEMRSTAALGRARSAMVLVSLGALPWLLRGQGGAVWLARVLGPAMLLLLNGVVPGWLGDRAAQLLNWRTLWAIPFTPLLGLAVAAGLDGGLRVLRRTGGWADGARLALVLALTAAFVARGTWAIEGDGIGYRFAAEKTLDRYEGVADVVLRHAGPDDVVAASPHISQALAMREDKPRLNGVWIRYVVNLTRHWGQEETDRRLRILQYARGKSKVVPEGDLDAQCITVLVTMPRHRGVGDTAVVVPRMGFRKMGAHLGHEVWVRDAQALPEACRSAQLTE